MTRTTKPDKYSLMVRDLARQFRNGDISLATFGACVSLIWKLRHGAA